MKPAKIETKADKLKTKMVVVIELMLPFNASYYGLLGAKYIPQLDSNTLDIEVRYVDESRGNLEDSISYNKKTVFVGLTKQYADMVLDTAISLLKSDVNTPSGR